MAEKNEAEKGQSDEFHDMARALGGAIGHVLKAAAGAKEGESEEFPHRACRQAEAALLDRIAELEGRKPPASDAPTAAPGANDAGPEQWPEIPSHLVNPLVFRDANLGIVLVSGTPGDQMIWRKHASAVSGFHWCSVRKVDERDGFQWIDALNLPKPNLPPRRAFTPPVLQELTREEVLAKFPEADHLARLMTLLRDIAYIQCPFCFGSTRMGHPGTCRIRLALDELAARSNELGQLHKTAEKLKDPASNHDDVQDAAAGER